MKAEFPENKDEITPALRRLLRNNDAPNRMRTLGVIGDKLVKHLQHNISNELDFEGKPMKSPAKETRLGGRFSKGYLYRYRDGFRHMSTAEKRQHKATGKVGRRQTKETERGVKVRRRIPVTETSKQLSDTGRTVRDIGVLTIDPGAVRVGGKSGHANFILSVHDADRKPAGISKKFADEAREIAFYELLKGV